MPRPVAATAVLAAALLTAPAVFAAGAPTRTTVIMLLPQPVELELLPVARAIESQLLDLPVRFRPVSTGPLAVEPAAATGELRAFARRHGADVVVRCDPGEITRVLVLVTASSAAPVTREVQEGTAQSAREAIALIVRGVLSAALEDGDGAPVVATSEAADSQSTGIPPVPPATPRRELPPAWYWLTLELAYAYQPFSSSRPATHALHFGLVISLHEHWCLLAGFRYFPVPVIGRSPSAVTRLHRYPASLGARFRWRFDDLVLGVDLLASLDYADTRTRAPSLEIDPDQSDLQFTLLPGLHLGYRIATRLRAFLLVGAEIFINPRRYGVLGREGTEVLLEPWTVRPQLTAGIAGDVW